jgi:hypothetical protein
MHPAVLERARAVSLDGGIARISFDLPRFGISLLTFMPANKSGSEPEAAPPSDCSCRLRTNARTPLAALYALAFVGLLRRRRLLLR